MPVPPGINLNSVTLFIPTCEVVFGEFKYEKVDDRGNLIPIAPDVLQDNFRKYVELLTIEWGWGVRDSAIDSVQPTENGFLIILDLKNAPYNSGVVDRAYELVLQRVTDWNKVQLQHNRDVDAWYARYKREKAQEDDPLGLQDFEDVMF